MKEDFITIMTDYYGGDRVEKEGWPKFGGKKFPNYEKFWQRFVVPRTNRLTDLQPTDIQPKDDIEDIECEIMSIHWQIFNNFNFIYKHLSDLEEDSDEANNLFDHSFIKLSNTCDLTEELMFKLLCFLKKIDASSINSRLSVNISKWPKDKVFLRICERNSLSFSITDRFTEVRKVLKNKEIKKKLNKYSKIAEPIHKYRNIIAHSWQTFHIDGKVPKPEYVRTYKIWVNATRILKSTDQEAIEKLKKEHYIKKELLMKNKADELINILNILWEQLISLVGNSDYEKFKKDKFKKYLDSLTSGDCASGSETIGIKSSVASGTANTEGFLKNR